LFQSISLLMIGIMTIIITSWYLSKEENNDWSKHHVKHIFVDCCFHGCSRFICKP